MGSMSLLVCDHNIWCSPYYIDYICYSGAQSCSPNSPVDTSKTSSQSSSTTGLQALIPSYNFSCNGIITQVTFRANKFVDGGFVFQIWRPRREGMYTLQSSTSVPQSAKRDGDDVTFNCSIPVLIGDTIGYRLPYVPGSEEMRFILQSETDVVLHRRMTEDVLCGLSLCDNRTLTEVHNLAPFISIVFGNCLMHTYLNNRHSVCLTALHDNWLCSQYPPLNKQEHVMTTVKPHCV